MTAPPELPQLIGGRYRPLGVIGRGGMGVVYSVEHVRTGERLALKVLTAQLAAGAEALERFRREARISARIKSEHVVRVIDADVAPELGGLPFLVMDLLDGGDLAAISGGKACPREDVVEWLGQTARALDKAHSLGIVHRDLKPENLFLCTREDGRPLVKILDYGIAKLQSDSPGGTKAGDLLGTPLYMAPEQALGDIERIGPHTDRYALAQIAHTLLTGRPYRNEATVPALLAAVAHQDVVAPSERGSRLGEGFDRWFVRACSRDPRARFASAAEQITALAEALGLAAEPGAPNRADPIVSTLEGAATLDAAATGVTSSGSARLGGRRRAAAVAVAVLPLMALFVAWPRAPREPLRSGAFARARVPVPALRAPAPITPSTITAPALLTAVPSASAGTKPRARSRLPAPENPLEHQK